MTAELEPEPADLSPAWAELIARAIEDRLYHLHTGLPAKVLSYDPASQSAKVQPVLQRAFEFPDGSVKVVDCPELNRVPVVFPGGNGWAIRFRLKPDDEVFLAFAERSLDRWKDSPAGAMVDPLESRKHDLTDAIAIPSLRRRAAAMPDPGDDLVIGREDGSTEIRLKPDGTIELGPAANEGVARLKDPTLVDSTTDGTFTAWLAAVQVFIGALAAIKLPTDVPGIPALVSTFISSTGGAPPSSVTGKISGASELVKSK